ncbi:MAG: hypothetical protein VX077_09950 [Pseudomonadota bacterium]|nr:hypothetical protein [Pseudomonadota bacterium]
MTDNDDILILIARRAGGERLNREEKAALDRAMRADPDLALLLLDAADVAAEATDAAAAAKQERRASGGRLRMAALVMGLAACIGLGATAGAQLASGLLSGGGMAIGSSQPTMQVEFRGVGDALNLKVRTGSREK